MSSPSFNYYGYDKDTYRDCKEQIRWMNLKHTAFLNTWFLILTVIFLGIRIYDGLARYSVFVQYNMNGLDRIRLGVFIGFAVAAAGLEFLTWLFLKRREWEGKILMYLNMVAMIAFSLMISMAQSMKPAILFYVFLILIAVTYMDTMISMSITMIGFVAVFLYSVFRVIPLFRYQPKPLSIANEDVFYAVVILSLSLLLHYTRQRTRLQQFVTYLKNIQITHELEVRSSFDALTSILNRGRFMAMASEVLRGRHDDEYMAICLLDLDGFKQINDKLGHQMGDKAIQLAGQVIIGNLGLDLTERWNFPERALQEHLSFAGRLGGDEFIILMRGGKDKEAVIRHLDSMLETLNKVDFGELHGLRASFGVTEIAPEDKDIDKAYAQADDALYNSKRKGKNTITFYAPDERKDDM